MKAAGNRLLKKNRRTDDKPGLGETWRKAYGPLVHGFSCDLGCQLASILGRPEVTVIAFSLLYPLTRGLIGVLIWVKSERLAFSIFPTTVAADNLVAQSQQEWLLSLAISIIGFVFVVEAIPTLVYNATLFVVSHSSAYRSTFGFVPEAEQRRIWSTTAEASVLAAFARILIGFGLLLGPARLAGLVAALRGVGESQDFPPNESSAKRS
jgi:hypothetical protein